MHEGPFEHQSVRIQVFSLPVLLVILKFTLIQVAVSVIIHSLSMHFVIDELAFVKLAVRPLIATHPVHLSFSPFPSVI